MSSTERYLDRVGLKQYTDELNAHLKGRMKYIGEAPIYQDTTAKTRTNWNDLIVISGTPSLIGNIFKLSGTSGDTVEVGGVTYMVGEYIIVTNEVDADDSGTLSDDITIMKFSSETPIDSITIVHNDEAQIRAKSAIEITAFPTDPITETMYRLTADTTVGTEIYKAGLYVYDEPNTKWISVGGAPIDEKTIVKDSDGKLETAVGGWKETGSSVQTVNLTKEANTFNNQVSGSDYYLEGIIDNDTYTLLTNNNQATLNNLTFSNSGDTYFVNYVGTQSATKSADGKYTFNIEFNVQNVIIENITAVIDTSTGTNVMRFYLVNGASSFFTGDYYRGDNTIEVTVVDDVYHPLESKYINIDEVSIINEEGITGEETGVLHAKSAIEITAFPAAPLTETIYRLTSDLTVGTVTYNAGLYVYDGTDWLTVGGSPIDEKTIVKNSDGKIETAVGGYTTTVGSQIDKTTANVTSDSAGNITISGQEITNCTQAELVDVLAVGNTIKFVFTKVSDPTTTITKEFSIVRLDGLTHRYVFSDGSGTDWGEIDPTTSPNVFLYLYTYGFEADTEYSIGTSFIPNTEYHPLESKFLNLDDISIVSEEGILGQETGLLHAKSAIEVTTFPTSDILTETIYRLTADVTIGTEEYKAGLYVYDAANTKWIGVGGSPIDEKTIVKNTDGELETAVGGWKDGSSSIDRNIRTSAAVTLALKSGTTNEFEFAANPALSVFEDKESNVLISNFTAVINGKTYTATSTQTISYQTFGTTFFGYKISNLDITDGTYTLNISLEFLEDETYPAYYAQNLSLIDNNAILSAGETIEFNFNFKVDKSVYHPLESKYVNIDEVSIVNEEGITGEETGVLHAKSAIEVDTFPTTDILTETIYRLTTDVTIGTEEYKAGLYVYDEPNTKWISVGGSPIDEKTIIKNSDGELKTAVGGWSVDAGSLSLAIDGSITITSTILAITNYITPTTEWDQLQLHFKSGQTCTVTVSKKDDPTTTKDYVLTWQSGNYFSDTNYYTMIFYQGSTAAENKARFYCTDSSFLVAGTEYVCTFKLSDVIIYHPLETNFISIDNNTIYNDTSDTTLETGVLMARPIINSNTIATDKLFSDRQCIYRLKYDTTIDDIKYGRGVYYFDETNYKWKRMPETRSGDNIDNKTITNWSCSGSPDYTYIHSDFNGFKTYFDIDFFRDPRISYTWNYTSSTKTGILIFTTTFDIDLTKLVSGSSILVRATNGMGSDVSLWDNYNGSSWSSGSVVEKNKITITLDNTIAPTFNFADANHTGGLIFNGSTIKYHTLSNDYINIDNNTIYKGTDTNEVDGNKYLHAKSAIEITAFPDEPLNETIYRLLNDVTVGTETYKAGLYVYDITTSAWKSLSADVAIDEKTIIKNTDDKIETAVGGWKEEDKIDRHVTTTSSNYLYYNTSSTDAIDVCKLYLYPVTSFNENGTCIFSNFNFVLDGATYTNTETFTASCDYSIEEDYDTYLDGTGYSLQNIILESGTATKNIRKLLLMKDESGDVNDYTFLICFDDGSVSSISGSFDYEIDGTKSTFTISSAAMTQGCITEVYNLLQSSTIYFTEYEPTESNVQIKNLTFTIGGNNYTTTNIFTVSSQSIVSTYVGYNLGEFDLTDGTNTIHVNKFWIMANTSRPTYYCDRLAIQVKNCIHPNDEISVCFDFYKKNGDIYHPIETNYINIDGTTILNANAITAETGALKTAVGGFADINSLKEEFDISCSNQTVESSSIGSASYYVNLSSGQSLIPGSNNCRAVLTSLTVTIDGTKYSLRNNEYGFTELYGLIYAIYVHNVVLYNTAGESVVIAFLESHRTDSASGSLYFYSGGAVTSSSVISVTGHIQYYNANLYSIDSRFMPIDGTTIVRNNWYDNKISANYSSGTTLPSTGTTGQIFFLYSE